MNIYIAKATGQHVPHEVIDSLKAQSMTCGIYEIGAPGIVESCGLWTEERAKGEENTRNLIRRIAIMEDERYFCMNDSDTMHLNNDNIRDAVRLLDSDGLIGAVAFSRDNVVQLEGEHILMASMVIRTDIMNAVDFEVTPRECCCLLFTRAVRKTGFKIRYSDTTCRIKTVPRL